MNYTELYAEWEQEKLNEGRREAWLEGKIEGKIEGLQDVILAIYKCRFGSVPEALERKVRSQNDEATLFSWCNPFMFNRADEIALKLSIY